MYRIIDLGANRIPFDVNNHGHVCGAEYPSGAPFVWNARTGYAALSSLSWYYGSYAWAINDAGQVAGTINPEEGASPRAFRWDPSPSGSSGALEFLAVPPSDPTDSEARAIDVNGRCAGTIGPSTALKPIQNIIWQTPQNAIQILLYRALDMNDYGQVVGALSDDQAALWQPDAAGATTGTTHRLDLPVGATAGRATAINASGQVLGNAVGFPVKTVFGELSQQRAFLWTPASPNDRTGSAVELGVLPEEQQVFSESPRGALEFEASSAAPITHLFARRAASEAGGINNHGTVVGTTYVSGVVPDRRAFIYARGIMRDLNSLVPGDSGWVLQDAHAINDSGWVVGAGLKGNEYRGFVLEPLRPLLGLDELIPAPLWHSWLKRGLPVAPDMAPAAAPTHVVAEHSLAAAWFGTLPRETRDVLASVAATAVAASLQDAKSRRQLQTSALEIAARAIEHLLLQLRRGDA